MVVVGRVLVGRWTGWRLSRSPGKTFCKAGKRTAREPISVEVFLHRPVAPLAAKRSNLVMTGVGNGLNTPTE